MLGEIDKFRFLMRGGGGEGEGGRSLLFLKVSRCGVVHIDNMLAKTMSSGDGLLCNALPTEPVSPLTLEEGLD